MQGFAGFAHWAGPHTETLAGEFQRQFLEIIQVISQPLPFHVAVAPLGQAVLQFLEQHQGQETAEHMAADRDNGIHVGKSALTTNPSEQLLKMGMTNDRARNAVGAARSDQRNHPETIERGYQPVSSQPLDPATLKPPCGGSAIQPPEVPVPKAPKQ